MWKIFDIYFGVQTAKHLTLHCSWIPAVPGRNFFADSSCKAQIGFIFRQSEYDSVSFLGLSKQEATASFWHWWLRRGCSTVVSFMLLPTWTCETYPGYHHHQHCVTTKHLRSLFLKEKSDSFWILISSQTSSRRDASATVLCPLQTRKWSPTLFFDAGSLLRQVQALKSSMISGWQKGMFGSPEWKFCECLCIILLFIQTSLPVETDRLPPASTVNWMQFFFKCILLLCDFWRKTNFKLRCYSEKQNQPSELAACDCGAAAAAAVSTVWMQSEPSLSWAALHFRYLSKYQAEQTGTLLFQSEWEPNCLWGLKWNCLHTKQ